MATTKLTDKTPVTTLAGTDKVVVATSSGIAPMTLANFRTAFMGGHNLNALEDGIFIFAISNDSSNSRCLFKPSRWAAIKNSYTALGVVVMNGANNIVVSLVESTLKWSTAPVAGSGGSGWDIKAAMADFDGEANTTAQVSHAECSPTTVAPGYCHAYSKLNANAQGQGAGKWWLPSVGELVVIYSNIEKINYALSLIDGATTLSTAGYYWSSSEIAANTSYIVGFDSGIEGGLKASRDYRVRPVSTVQ